MFLRKNKIEHHDINGRFTIQVLNTSTVADTLVYLFKNHLIYPHGHFRVERRMLDYIKSSAADRKLSIYREHHTGFRSVETSFYGSGLDDISVISCVANLNMIVSISKTGRNDEITCVKDNIRRHARITGADQGEFDCVIRFAATTGHVLHDQWNIRITDCPTILGIPCRIKRPNGEYFDSLIDWSSWPINSVIKDSRTQVRCSHAVNEDYE